jgi:hypothetical protein
MPKFGVVKMYSTEFKFGFIFVQNEDHTRTGDVVFFHISSACKVEGVYSPGFTPCVDWLDEQATLDDFGCEPVPGNAIVFEVSTDVPRVGKHRRVARWTLLPFWDDALMEAQGRYLDDEEQRSSEPVGESGPSLFTEEYGMRPEDFERITLDQANSGEFRTSP